MNFKAVLLKELIIILALSGVPLLIAFSNGGNGGLGDFMMTLIPTSKVLYYLFSLLVVFFFVAFVDWFVYKRSEANKIFWAFMLSILREVGAAFLGVLRVFVGVCFVFPLVWIVTEPLTFETDKAFVFILYGVIALVECIFFSFAFQYVKKWERRLI